MIDEYKELKHLAYHDLLTGLPNRNWLHKNLYSIKHTYIYFIDINNLHEINKSGHTVGDSHIIMIVSSIRLRANDILIRYAGDEFILFSNFEERLVSNRLYAVGFSVNTGNLINAINEADKNMLKSKRKYIKR